MSNIYLLSISLIGFFLLLFLSISSFLQVESLKIKIGQSTKTGLVLLISSFVYFIFSVLIWFLSQRKNKKRDYIKKYYKRNSDEVHNIVHRSSKYQIHIEDEDEKSS